MHRGSLGLLQSRLRRQSGSSDRDCARRLARGCRGHPLSTPVTGERHRSGSGIPLLWELPGSRYAGGLSGMSVGVPRLRTNAGYRLPAARGAAHCRMLYGAARSGWIGAKGGGRRHRRGRRRRTHRRHCSNLRVPNRAVQLHGRGSGPVMSSDGGHAAWPERPFPKFNGLTRAPCPGSGLNEPTDALGLHVRRAG